MKKAAEQNINLDDKEESEQAETTEETLLNQTRDSLNG